MTIELDLGGYAIRLRDPENRPCIAWPLAPFDKFMARSDLVPDLHLHVRVVSRLPELPRGPLRFDACHGLWKLFDAGPGALLLESLDPRCLTPRVRTLVSEDYSRAEVWALAQRSWRNWLRAGWAPMAVFNPTVEVCLLTRLARDGGLALHAAGVLTPRGARVFSGASGDGKSTLSGLFAARAARVLSDERVIIRRVGGDFRAYGTPWIGTARHAANDSGPLVGLYRIRHGTARHTLRPLPPAESVRFLLTQCLLPHWDRAAMDRTLILLDELVGETACRELAFLNEPDVVDFVESRHAPDSRGSREALIAQPVF